MSRHWKLALFLSLMIHIFMMAGVLLAPHLPKSESTNIEVTLEPMDPNSLNAPIATSAPVPKNRLDENSKKRATVMTDQFQRVKEETQAALKGRTSNSLTPTTSPQESSGSNGKEKQSVAQSKNSVRKNRETSPDGEAIKPDPYSDYKPIPGFQGGPSRVGESIDDSVKVGTITALNSDKYTFYSFFARIQDQTRFRWEDKVEAAVEKMDRSKAILNSRRHWVTQLEFLISPSGELKQILVLKESGLPAFDQAAILAFREAKNFPNPPKEMVKEDGFIHLRFAFDIDYTPPMLSNTDSDFE